MNKFSQVFGEGENNGSDEKEKALKRREIKEPGPKPAEVEDPLEETDLQPGN